MPPAATTPTSFSSILVKGCRSRTFAGCCRDVAGWLTGHSSGRRDRSGQRTTTRRAARAPTAPTARRSSGTRRSGPDIAVTRRRPAGRATCRQHDPGAPDLFGVNPRQPVGSGVIRRHPGCWDSSPSGGLLYFAAALHRPCPGGCGRWSPSGSPGCGIDRRFRVAAAGGLFGRQGSAGYGPGPGREMALSPVQPTPRLTASCVIVVGARGSRAIPARTPRATGRCLISAGAVRSTSVSIRAALSGSSACR